MKKTNILIVEDDKAVGKLISTALETHNYQRTLAGTGSEALIAATSGGFEIILLDLGLPDMDGVTVISRIREWSNIPIIVISARTDDSDKIEALDSGADDYLTKPFSVEELLARIRVAERRVKQDRDKLMSESSVFVNGDLVLDYNAGILTIEGKEIHLTPIEYKLITLLSKNIGKVLTHNFIIREIWGSMDIPALRVFMVALRKKIEKDPSDPEYIQTHVGIGYRMLKVSKTGEEKIN